jgi:hypothetical protein
MWFALRIAILSLLLCLPARAQDIQVGPALACDTEEQVERFAAVFSGDAKSAAKAVNAEVNNPTACDVITVAYVTGPEIATVRTDIRRFSIVRILVLGVVTEDGILVSQPTPFYSYIQLDERGV